MAKITKLEQKTFEGKPQGFKVTFDDGRTGNLNEKESDKGLREGDEVFVTEIPYKSKAGKESILYGVHLTQGGAKPSALSAAPPPRPAIHVGTGKSKEELKVNASIAVLERILSAFYDGKLQSAQISVELKEYDRLIWSEIDEIFSGR